MPKLDADIQLGCVPSDGAPEKKKNKPQNLKKLFTSSLTSESIIILLKCPNDYTTVEIRRGTFSLMRLPADNAKWLLSALFL